MTRAAAYLPVDDGRSSPGRLSEVSLDIVDLGPNTITLPEATIRDERGDALLDGGTLVFDPAAGGGPLVTAAADRQARAFGLVNTAVHVQRAMRFAAGTLGRPLPRLLVRIGMHDSPRRWGGGHYRLPGPDEAGIANAAGEVHLGGGRTFLRLAGGRYFHAPAHNIAIVYHEVGHHIGRHTADFRLNGRRPADQQISGKTGIDEGTADLITAILLDSPDIYGWHRGAVPESDQRRRKLDPRWTMAHFVGKRDYDQHADGTIWASACWSARQAIVDAGTTPDRFDRLLLHGLDGFGRDGSGPADLPPATADRHLAAALRPRRHFSRLLAAMVATDPELGPVVLAAMARHGIRPAGSNMDLAEAAQAGLKTLVRT